MILGNRVTWAILSLGFGRALRRTWASPELYRVSWMICHIGRVMALGGHLPHVCGPGKQKGAFIPLHFFPDAI